MENSKIENLLAQILENQISMKDSISSLNNKVDNLETKVDKNTILLEKAQNDIKLLAEGHTNLVEHTNSKFKVLEKKIDDNYSLHNEAIKKLAKDVKYIKYRLYKTEEDVFDIKDHLENC